MTGRKVSSLFLVLAAAGVANSARILGFFPLPRLSHHFVYRPIMEGLAQRGHQVVYYTPIPYDTPVPKNITQILLPEYPDRFKDDTLYWGKYSVISYLMNAYHLGQEIADSYMSSKPAQELINSKEKFDVVLLESSLYQLYLSAFIHKFNAIGVEIMCIGDNAWFNVLSGLPDNPAYQNDNVSEMSDHESLFERLYNTYLVTIITTIGQFFLYIHQFHIVNRYFTYEGYETRPCLEHLAKNRSLILANSHYIVGQPYPMPPHRKEIGGIHVRQNKSLPMDLQIFMNESTAGVIYMSLGSHRANLEQQIAIFASSFSELRQKVLLKFEGKLKWIPPPNIMIKKWFPQQDILAHPNCVLFVTDGGLLSVMEAVHFGVPILGVPLFADEPKNLIAAEKEGYGRMLRFDNLTTSSVLWSVREILKNSRYKEEAMKRSKILRDRRYTPAEEAVYWIEHSIKYPFAMTPKSVSLGIFQLHRYDITIFVIGILIVTVCLSYWSFNFYMSLKKKKRQRKKKRN